MWTARWGEISFRTPEALLICECLQQSGVEVYLAMPHIFRNETEALFTAQYAEKDRDGFDGILVRNLESIRFLERIGFDRNVITDHNLYVFNRYTKQFWKENGIGTVYGSVGIEPAGDKRAGDRGW